MSLVVTSESSLRGLDTEMAKWAKGFDLSVLVLVLVSTSSSRKQQGILTLSGCQFGAFEIVVHFGFVGLLQRVQLPPLCIPNKRHSDIHSLSMWRLHSSL